ncbi:MAG: PadR family transcriptional regulator [Anaerolineae bacterium]|jgi:DNA-binding PadR family transcriptional regulator|nr:PadR family transcriptional regulator [Anaerolineae bacterium]MBT7484103.1 PadR family transcriptional regulator [Candidatus Peregrinibacteria bacterium]MBT4308837.1 PadR family transcriptional regulator [Anaerolineae bacterium]MBT4456698.1 PadR family transcriptional regulator [Anaerolineae bacterium]MBT4843288.1 PadR family transcriptional regulator [Anaerolineae bacterium]
MSLKHAILGFLSFKPLSGYDLKKTFDNSVRHFWTANQSQIYRTLSKMTDEGLLSKEIIERDERLDMKIYHVSEKGRAELHQWLASPLPRQNMREPFLIQVFFSGLIDDEELLGLLHYELRIAEEELAAYTQTYQASMSRANQAEDPRAFFLSMLTLDYGLKSSQAMLDWLTIAIKEIEAKTYSPTQI